MDQYTYTNELPNSNSISDITSVDVVLLNGSNIINDIDAQYNGINPIPSFTIVKSISSLLSAKLSVIDDKLSSYDSCISSHMKYYGAFLNGYIDDESQSNHRVLSNFLASNLGNAATIDNGTMFRFISAVVLSDQQDSIEFLSNDYIIFNKDVPVIVAQLSDFDIIRDACNEIEELSTEISTKVDILDISSYASKVIIDNRISNISGQTDLSIVKLSIDEYAMMLSNDQTLSNVLYIVEDNNINAYGQQMKNLAFPTDLSDAATKGYVDDISSSLKSQIQKLSDDLSGEISGLEDNVLSNDAYLSAAIDTKIFIDGLSAESLCAIHIDQQDYYDLVSSNSTISNVLYVVSSENINAYGQRIENLAAPINLSDATTKEYVDNADASLSGDLSNLISSMYDSLSAIEVDETISSLNQKSCISAVISAVVGIRDTLASLRQTMSTILGI